MTYPFELMDLPFEYDALEPHIDAKTMEIHHTKHHQGYTDKLNKALETFEEFRNLEIEEILKDLNSVPDNVRDAVRNNGGGYYNHNLYFSALSPERKEVPENLKTAVEKRFKTFEDFKKEFSETAGSHFGSGWCWLVTEENGDLNITTTPNQNNPLMFTNAKPILGIDLWEHAYYLKHQNKRADYILAWWQVVDWDVVAERL